MPLKILLATTFVLFSWHALQAQEAESTDWPQLLGRSRNGVVTGTQGISLEAPPKVVWTKDVGEGFSGPVVVDDSVVLFHRPQAARSKNLIVERFNRDTGASLWKSKIATEYRSAMDGDSGPKATPVVQDGYVYCHGPDGELACLEFGSGKILWQFNARKKLKAGTGYFGCGSSPIVVDEKLILNVGGKRGAAIVAFDTKTGKILWQAVNDSASYSSPIVVPHAGKSVVIFLTRTKFVGLDAANGKVLFSNEFGKPGPTAVGAMPVAFGSKVFANAAYRVGATVVDLVNISSSGGSIKPDWSSQQAFASHYGTPVFYEGHFFGTSGREDFGNGSFRCIDATTGDIKWDEPEFGVGHTFRIGDQLLTLGHRGTLRLVSASSQEFKLLGKAVAFKGGTRAIPAISKGVLYFRSNSRSGVGKLIALDVTP